MSHRSIAQVFYCTFLSCGIFLGCLDSSFTAGFAGQLGLNHTIDVVKPQSIDIFRGISIAKVACGGHHTLFLTADNQLFACGGNSHGQLGLGHTQNIHAPQRIEAFVNKRILDFDCARHHSIVLTADKEVYTFGNNEYGEMCGFLRLHPLLLAA